MVLKIAFLLCYYVALLLITTDRIVNPLYVSFHSEAVCLIFAFHLVCLVKKSLISFPFSL